MKRYIRSAGEVDSNAEIQQGSLPSYEEFQEAEWERLSGGSSRKQVGNLFVTVCTDKQWTPLSEAVYWYVIKVGSDVIKESKEFAASNSGREKCWRELERTLKKMLHGADGDRVAGASRRSNV